MLRIRNALTAPVCGN